jgi:hypothetical protein
VSARERLERQYRRLLACYPREFRRENEDEILGVLLSVAADSQRRVGMGEAADLIRGAVRARLRLPTPCPATVRAAVRLMCAGAVLELGYLVTVALSEGSVRSAILARYPGFTAAQWHAVVLARLLPDEVSVPVGVAMWLWMAWALGKGHDWARVVFGVIFGLSTLSLLVALAQGAAVYAPADLAAGVTLWLVELAGMLLIFSKHSAQFYRPEPGPRASADQNARACGGRAALWERD